MTHQRTAVPAVCEVDTSGAPYSKPLRVKVWVQKTSVWWRWLPRPVFKKVAVFNFHWEELWRPRQAYTSLPATMDVGRLQKAIARSGEALVKMVVTHAHGKVTATTPVGEFVRRLGEEGPEGFVLRVSMVSEASEAREDQQPPTRHESEGKEGQAEAEAERGGSEGQGEAPWVGKTCKCPACVLPFWEMLQAWEPLPVKPPTVMDLYVDLLSTECTVMEKEAKLLVKGKKSYKSELAALLAEMDLMEAELDRAEDSWANVVMGAAEEEDRQHPDGEEEEEEEEE